jgi:DNA modification methylase
VEDDKLKAATNAGLIDVRIEYRAVAELVLDKRNPRQHPQKQVNQLADSIREFGFLMPVVADCQGQVIVGHGRVLAAKKLRMPQIPVIQIRHLSPGQLKGFRMADNRLAQHSHWDERLLGENFLELKELNVDFDLSVIGFTLPEIDLTVQKLQESQRVATDDDNVDAATGVPVCEVRQTWQLGDHYLHCGDATSEEAFALLMMDERADAVFVDPPYNVPVKGHVSGKGKVRHREFAQGVGELNRDEFIQFLIKNCGLRAQTLYRSQHELIFVFKSGTGRHTNNVELGKNGRNRTNVWKYDSASAQARKGNNLLALHPTAKPIQLVMDALLDCSYRGDVVLDCFLGSGTTLLAAEQTGRICRGIELDPLYIDTAIRRWQNLTGRDAIRCADGKLFREIEAEKETADER